MNAMSKGPKNNCNLPRVQELYLPKQFNAFGLADEMPTCVW